MKPEIALAKQPNIDRIPTEFNKERSNHLLSILGRTLDAGAMTQAEYEKFVLRVLRVRVDIDHQVCLYHAVPADILVRILNDEAIRPPIETGQRTWRVLSEENSTDPFHINKRHKVYLATGTGIRTVAKHLHETDGRGIYILEARVDPANLEEDEDSYKRNWIESIAAMRTCSHRGRIASFSVVGRSETTLHPDISWDYFHREVAADDVGDKLGALRTRLEWQNLNKANQDKEYDLVRAAGLEPRSIPIIELLPGF